MFSQSISKRFHTDVALRVLPEEEDFLMVDHSGGVSEIGGFFL